MFVMQGSVRRSGCMSTSSPFLIYKVQNKCSKDQAIFDKEKSRCLCSIIPNWGCPLAVTLNGNNSFEKYTF